MSRQQKPAKTKAKARRGATPAAARMSVAAHPRARRHVRQAKGWAGLGGFGLALILAIQAHVPATVGLERAVIAGIAGYLIGWGCALAIWRALLTAELRAQAELVKARRAEAAAAGETQVAR